MGGGCACVFLHDARSRRSGTRTETAVTTMLRMVQPTKFRTRVEVLMDREYRSIVLGRPCAGETQRDEDGNCGDDDAQNRPADEVQDEGGSTHGPRVPIDRNGTAMRRSCFGEDRGCCAAGSAWRASGRRLRTHISTKQRLQSNRCQTSEPGAGLSSSIAKRGQVAAARRAWRSTVWSSMGPESTTGKPQSSRKISSGTISAQ